jgi:Fur family peroxide stress response transcriptional regulator
MDLKKKLTDKGLKVTSKRLCILEGIVRLKHPTAEEILNYIRKEYPETATATVYKALNVLTDRKVIYRVENVGDTVRYDAIMEAHHHLYNPASGRIEDYKDQELTTIVRDYLRKKRIKGFSFRDFKLQIIGSFDQKLKS